MNSKRSPVAHKPDEVDRNDETARTALLCLAPASAGVAEGLKVLSAVGMREVLVESAPTFERATGHKLASTFDSGARIVKRIEGGEAADVVIVPQEAARQLVSAGRALPGSVRELASSRVGVAVRAGAPRPDIASPETLTQTLLSARSVARPDPTLGGSSGLHIQRMLEQLGIADAPTGPADREPVSGMRTGVEIRRSLAKEGAAGNDSSTQIDGSQQLTRCHGSDVRPRQL